MELDSPEEEFFSSGKKNLVYPASKESAIYLLRILKSKEYDVDNIFNQFFLTLNHLLKSSEFNLSDFLLRLIQNLRQISAPPIICKKLMLALEVLIKDQGISIESSKASFNEHWKTIEVEILDLVFKIFDFQKTESE
jgi:hypothetical protein